MLIIYIKELCEHYVNSSCYSLPFQRSSSLVALTIPIVPPIGHALNYTVRFLLSVTYHLRFSLAYLKTLGKENSLD